MQLTRNTMLMQKSECELGWQVTIGQLGNKGFDKSHKDRKEFT